MKNKKIISILFLMVILLIAAFFRLWRLSSVPPGLYPDVAINGNDALDALETKNFKLFYPENNGREGFFMWLIAFSFLIFGPSIWAIKIVSAIIGIFTVLGLYLLSRELFSKWGENGSRSIALLSAFFLATSFWHTNFSRIGFRAIMVPFILVFSFYFLFRGFRATLLHPQKGGLGKQERIWNFIIAGIFFGLGFYTYISFRLAVPLLLIVLFFWWLVCRKQWLPKKFILTTSYLLLTTFITALPIGIYFLKNPQDFFGRAKGVSIFSQANPIFSFLKSLAVHLGMFNFHGDPNWRHNFSGLPMLFFAVGLLFLVGFVLTLKNLVVSIKNKKYSSIILPCFLFSWFFLMLLPGVLTYEGIPHALRVVGVIPPVYIFSGFGAFFIFEQLKKFYKTKVQFISFVLIVFIFLFSIAYSEFDKYFFQWGKNPEVKGAFSENYLKMGDYLNSLPENLKKYVIVNQGGVPVPWPNGLPMPAQTPIFIERIKYRKPQSIYLLPENINQIKIDEAGGTIIVFMGYDENLFKEAWKKFPGGNFQGKEGFWIYEIRQNSNF